jgi:hypothetical protein
VNLIFGGPHNFLVPSCEKEKISSLLHVLGGRVKNAHNSSNPATRCMYPSFIYVYVRMRSSNQLDDGILQNREYLPMGGSVKVIDESLKLAYGEDSEFIKDKRIAAVQALSGTGACRLFADFQKRFLPDTQIYIPTPTWAK